MHESVHACLRFCVRVCINSFVCTSVSDRQSYDRYINSRSLLYMFCNYVLVFVCACVSGFLLAEPFDDRYQSTVPVGDNLQYYLIN